MGFSPRSVGVFTVIFGEKGYFDYGYAGCPFMRRDGGIIRRISAGTVRNAVPDYCECLVSDEADAGDVMDKFFSFLSANKLDGNVSVVSGGLLLSVAGKSAHASLPHLGVNAAGLMLKFLGEITDESPFVNAYNALFGTETTGQKAGIACSDKYGALTLNAGVVTTEGDGTARVTIDIRYPVTADFEPYAEILRRKMTACGAREVFVMAEKPLLIDPESPLVTQLMDAYRKSHGDYATKPRVIGGGRMPNRLKTSSPSAPNLTATTTGCTTATKTSDSTGCLLPWRYIRARDLKPFNL